MPALDLYLPGVGEDVVCVEEVEQEGERDEGQACHPQRPGQPDGAAGVQSDGYSPLPSCPLCHKTSLQHYRLLIVTKPSGEMNSDNSASSEVPVAPDVRG